MKLKSKDSGEAMSKSHFAPLFHSPRNDPGGSSSGQELTLLHFSAQPKHFSWDL